MRLVRLRLANYRGIVEAEVPFRRDGITVVTGPNEVGKSSIAEAVRILFDHLDSANNREVRSIRPVHRDEGPEIELEAESGPYSFRYAKRFHRRPQTTLTITRPRAENLTGREAHERANALLEETIDVGLWRSLLVTQGRGFEQADLSAQSALSEALDRAAGGLHADPGGDSLFDSVRQEAQKYFTEGGAERRELLDAREESAVASREVSELERALADLEEDIVAAARLADRMRGMDAALAALRDRAKGHEEALGSIEAASRRVDRALLLHESAGKTLAAAEGDLSAREALAAAAVEAGRALERAAAACGERGPEVASAEKGAEEAGAALTAADRARKEAEALAELRRRDLEHLRGLLDLELLRERKERVDRARAGAAGGREVLERNLVDDRRLRAVVEAEKGVLTAKAALAAGAPSLRVTAHEAVRLEIGGEARTLEKGAEEAIPVPDVIHVSVPGAVEIEVSPGTSLSLLQRDHEEARALLAEELGKAGVAGVEEAHRAHRERAEAERTVAGLLEVEKNDLRDLRYDQLETKVAGLSKHLPGYPASRPGGAPPLPADYEEARREDGTARAKVGEAVRAAEAARAAMERARERRDAERRECGELESARRSAADAARRAAAALEEARAGTPDASLKEALEAAREAAAATARDLLAAREGLEAMQPDRVRALAAANAASLGAAERQRSAAAEEADRVRRRLDSQGEAGLYERLEAATRRSRESGVRLAALLRAAGGARLLHETMGARRDAVRSAYLTPLRETIEMLGRVLFDATFRVEIENLEIRSRTLHDIAIPFADLSTGTKEQLSLIVRIACAMLMSEEGGPLLLDDVLGYSDPERLRAMGAVLRIGGEKCQIVLLTSVPDRYAHVGDALVVAME